jgi:hypothetical protein
MLFGICGKARSGKDSFAKLFAQELFNAEYGTYVLMAYATELKNMVQKDFDMSWDQLWGDVKEVPDERYFNKVTGKYWTPREILQSYGDFYRSIHSDYWVNALFDKIEDKEFKKVIVTDVRHVNEVEAVKSRGGTMIMLVRKDRDAIHGENHISETALDGYHPDIIVDNSGDLENLRGAASNIINIINSQNVKGGF